MSSFDIRSPEDSRFQRTGQSSILSVSQMKIDRTLIHSYPFTIRPLADSDGGGFIIEYPDLPGCVSDGDTPEEALENGPDAVKAYLLNCDKHGDPIPN